MSQEPLCLFVEPREETFLSRIWERWGNLVIVPLIVIAVMGANIWHEGKRQREKDRMRARIALMHRKLAEEAYALPFFARLDTYLAGYPHGLYFEPEAVGGDWTIKVPAEWTSAGSFLRTGASQRTLCSFSSRLLQPHLVFGLSTYSEAPPAPDLDNEEPLIATALRSHPLDAYGDVFG